MTIAPEDQGIDLLSKLLPKEWLRRKKIDRTELRSALFEAASVAFRLPVAPAETACSSWASDKMNYVKPNQLTKVNGLPLATLLSKPENSELPSVVGFHIVDSEVGRYSQIWIPPKRPCPPPSLTSSEAPSAWWKEYPDLWQPVYKQFLHPSTSLINAYKRGLLKFPRGISLLIHWDNSDVKSFKDHKTRIVSLFSKNHALQQFLQQTEDTLREFHKVLLRHCTSDLASKSEPAVIEEIGNELKNGKAKIIEMLRLIRDRYLLAVIEPGKPRDKFLKLLESLSAREGTIPSRLCSKKKEIWLGTDRDTAMEGIEVLQTILFNAPGFCSNMGLLIDHEKYDEADVFLILGREKGYEPTPQRCNQIIRVFQNHIASGFQSILKRKGKQPDQEHVGGSNPVVEEIFRYIRIPQDIVTGANRFMTFALKLSHEAIHEGRQLTFLLGCGHAEEPDVRCRKPIPIPKHLSRESVDLDLLVHFVKSYFSIFGRDDNLLWFDQKGRCCGLYERAPQDPKENWLDGWDDKSYFVRITGQDKLDFLEAETTVFPKGRHRPRVRVKGDLVIDLKSTSDIQSRTFVAAAQVFEANATRAYWVSELVAKIADRLREGNHGAGIVIVNMNADATNPGEWRSPIKEQEKSLVPKLHDRERAEGEKIQFKDNQHPSDSLVNNICSLAELDGAVYLSFEGEYMCLAPARHFFPLITEGKGDVAEVSGNVDEKDRANRVLQDFYKWAREGQRISRDINNVNRLRKFLERWLEKTSNIGFLKLGPHTFRREFNKYKNMHAFEDMNLLRLYTAYIRGLPKLECEDTIRKACHKLAFLNSSGTRHHSLWGITISSKQRAFVVSLSQDGRVSVFWDGRLIPSPENSK